MLLLGLVYGLYVWQLCFKEIKKPYAYATVSLLQTSVTRLPSYTARSQTLSIAKSILNSHFIYGTNITHTWGWNGHTMDCLQINLFTDHPMCSSLKSPPLPTSLLPPHSNFHWHNFIVTAPPTPWLTGCHTCIYVSDCGLSSNKGGGTRTQIYLFLGQNPSLLSSSVSYFQE